MQRPDLHWNSLDPQVGSRKIKLKFMNKWDFDETFQTNRQYLLVQLCSSSELSRQSIANKDNIFSIETRELKIHKNHSPSSPSQSHDFGMQR